MNPCPQCGAIPQPTDKFCNICGTPVIQGGFGAPQQGGFGAPPPQQGFGGGGYGAPGGAPAPLRCQMGHEIAPGASYCPHGHPIALDAMPFAQDAYGGAPQQPGYGAPAPQQGGFGAPPPQQAGWGAPAPQQGGFGGGGFPDPNAGAGGWGAPQQGGFGAPPPQQGGFGAPAPQQGGFGAPAPQPGFGGGGFADPNAGGFGAPQQQGGFGAAAPAQQPSFGQPAAQPAFGQPAAPAPVAAPADQPLPPHALRGFLVSYQSNSTGDFWPLHGGRKTIGRANSGESVDIPLSDATISSRHAAIAVDGTTGGVTLEDTGSTNGTFVNEEHIGFNGRRDLRDGDRIRFGGFTTIVKVISR